MIARGDLEERNQWSVYAQGVLHLGHNVRLLRGLHLVGRYEHFDPSRPKRAVNLGDLGVAWVPLPYLYLKTSYRFADHETDDVVRGMMASLSILF